MSQSKAYRTFNGMHQRVKKPHYRGCSVSPLWYNFKDFEPWFEENFIQGYCLNKDILVPGIYGPGLCCYVPQWLNILIGSGRRFTPRCRGSFYTVTVRDASTPRGRIYLGSSRTRSGALKMYLNHYNNRIDFAKSLVSPRVSLKL